MEKILLIGGGGHCKSVIDVIEVENRFEIAGIIDKKELLDSKVFDYKVIGCDEDLESLFNKYKYALITVGQVKPSKTRKKLYEKLLSIGYKLPVIISPTSYVSKRAVIKNGTIIMHKAFVNAGALIEENCIINTKALIEHDSIIKAHCHISTAAIINGDCEVKEGSFVGSNSTFVQGVSTKNNDFIKANILFKGYNE